MSTSPNMHELKAIEVFGIQANAIINELDDYFPPFTPSPNDSIEKIMYQAGQRSVVEWLYQRMEQ